MGSRGLGRFVDYIGLAMFISLSILFIGISVKSHIGEILKTMFSMQKCMAYISYASLLLSCDTAFM